MKEYHSEKPSITLDLGNGKTRVYYNSVEVTIEESTHWESDYIEVNSVDYENVVDSLIKRKYSISNELAIIRQRELKALEYQQYNKYCEECKVLAKELTSGTI